MAALQTMFDVRGLSVIVTGGASGIGKAYAEVMAEHGARVAILDLDPVGLEKTVAAIRAAGGDVSGDVVDVGDRPGMATAFDRVAERYGKIDVVFANAGIDPGPASTRRTARAIPTAPSRTSPTSSGTAASRSISRRSTRR